MYSISYQVPAPIEAYDALHAAVKDVTASDGEGLLVHIARPTETGFEIIEVWESQERFGAFMHNTFPKAVANTRRHGRHAGTADARSSNFAGFWSTPRTRSSCDRDSSAVACRAFDRRTGPRRNRVTPLGDIVAIPLRGAWLGNRGMLHRGTEVVRFHAGTAWITCALRVQGLAPSAVGTAPLHDPVLP